MYHAVVYSLASWCLIYLLAVLCYASSLLQPAVLGSPPHPPILLGIPTFTRTPAPIVTPVTRHAPTRQNPDFVQ